MELRQQIAAQASRVEDESDHLQSQLVADMGDYSAVQVSMALKQAKRVRRAVNVLVRQLAEHRDNLQP